MANITVYGADWCGDTRFLLQSLRKNETQFKYVNIDNDRTGEAKVIEANGGKRKIPVVEIGTRLLVNPTAEEVSDAAAGDDPERVGSRRDPEERPVEDRRELREKMLDKTLADSFPTSDPPSSIPDPETDDSFAA